MNLENVKEGDPVALFGIDGLRKRVAGRCTKTRVTIDGMPFTRSGKRVGDSKWSRTFAQTWEPRHDARLVSQQEERKLQNARVTLAQFRWREATQAQADAVINVMRSLGMLP